MIVTIIARRYGRALAEVALETGCQEAVRSDLEILIRLCREVPQFPTALKNPALPMNTKAALLDQVAGMIGVGFQPAVKNLVTLLLNHRRFGILEQVQAAFLAMIDERLGVLAGQLTTRFELNAKQRLLLSGRLEALTGKRVRLTFEKDETVLGGAILRIGGTIYDGSIRRQLQEIRHQLSGGI